MRRLSDNKLIRCLFESRAAWRLWLAPIVATAVTVPLSLGQPLVQRELVDGVILARRLDRLVPTLGLFAGLWLLIAVIDMLGGAARAYLNERLMLHLRRRVFAHCEALSVPLWHREHSGRTMALFSEDVPSLAAFSGTGLVLGFGNVVSLVVGAVVMFHLNWQLALVVVSVPPLIAGIAALVTRPLRGIARQARDKAAELNERLHESLGGLREIAAFGQERAQDARLAMTLSELLRLRMRLALIGAGIGAGQNVFSLAVTMTMYGVGGYLIINGQTTFGTLLAMQQLLGMVYQPAMALVGLVANAQQTLASADRVYALLDLQPMIRESPSARNVGQLTGSVRFDDVSFAYSGGRPALREVSFTASQGEVVALVGPSGAGKSTLAGLIARFYDPDEGRVLLDGVDARDLTLTWLRSQIGMVFQDPFLFATTIRENIAFGREDAGADEVIAAAQAAYAWEFIERLPAGLDTQVGQRAVRLSEGQKQRLAIARALLRKPRILILDEPTAALDARTEHLLQGALNNLMQGRTTFVIAHRLATIRRADCILVLDRGRVVERGSHAELIDRRGLYRELYDFQFSVGGAGGGMRDRETLAVA